MFVFYGILKMLQELQSSTIMNMLHGAMSLFYVSCVRRAHLQTILPRRKANTRNMSDFSTRSAHLHWVTCRTFEV